MDDVSFVRSSECYIESLNKVVDAVARERRYIAFVEGPTLSQAAVFVRHVLYGNGVQQLAVAAGNVVVGWCDTCTRAVVSRSKASSDTRESWMVATMTTSLWCCYSTQPTRMHPAAAQFPDRALVIIAT